jgi:hypothetical protein
MTLVVLALLCMAVHASVEHSATHTGEHTNVDAVLELAVGQDSELPEHVPEAEASSDTPLGTGEDQSPPDSHFTEEEKALFAAAAADDMKKVKSMIYGGLKYKHLKVKHSVIIMPLMLTSPEQRGQ